MLYEAVESGSFDRYAVAEVDQALVDAVRGNGDCVALNIAGRDGIRTKSLAGIRVYNPRVAADRAELVAAIRDSEEMATAVPSVSIYSAGGDSSVAALLAVGAVPGKQRILYAAENDNFAAEKLTEQVRARAPGLAADSLQVLNTVIGKMSGVISSTEEMTSLGLAALVPGFDRCVLVEEFNRILVSRVTLPGFVRGIRVFEEKDDLLPFEEAKLYGHNAIHALLGYLAWLRGLTVMSDIRKDPELLELGRRAFLDESGAALIARHRVGRDPLFSDAGWAAYAEDLLERMTNPWLRDRVERIIRDPRRKLGWNDRFFGAMRAALDHGIRPARLALGAAAALKHAIAQEKSTADPRAWLESLWGAEAAGPPREECLRLVLESMRALERGKS